MKQKPFFLLFLIFLTAISPPADVINVNKDLSTIQEAIDGAVDGDVIVVPPGVYHENINISGKNITLQSSDPLNPFVVASTIIDGGALDSVVTFSGTEETSCVLSGFTITNGKVEKGGGINGKGCHATIENNVISTNTLPLDFLLGNGGGIYKCNGTIRHNMIYDNGAITGGGLYECNGIIQDNMISNNTADGGGGVFACDGFITENRIMQNRATLGAGLYSCNGIIQNNEISGNLAMENGGGLSECSGIIRYNIIKGNFAGDPVFEYSTGSGGGLDNCLGLVFGNLICNNRAGYGGGIHGNSLVPLPGRNKTRQISPAIDINPYFLEGTFQHNTITSNTAFWGGGVSYLDGMIINNIIWGNIALKQDSQLYESSTPVYCCIQGWSPDELGNISQDPRFVDPDHGDFHLSSSSSCKDKGFMWYLAGFPITDIDGECRFEGEGVDIGYDEYNSYPDSDGDLLCDLDEMVLESDPNIMDTDGDGLLDGPEALRRTKPNVHNSPTGISVPDKFASIQQAIFLSFPLEEITISPGTYKENLHLLGKNITLQGMDVSNPEMEITSPTIINGNRLNAVITLQGNEDETCLIKDLTITNGSRGGIVGNGASPAIIRNRIEHNSPRGIMECHGLIESNRISSNTIEASYEIGAGLLLCDGIIQNNIITFNRAKGWATQGGGLALCFGTIRNNIIAYNSSQRGGGGLYQCNGEISNNTIAENTSEDPISNGGGISESYGEIKNCIIWGNKAASHEQIWASSKPSYSCIQDWSQAGTDDNISDNPLFMESGDIFELGGSSPCIDAGNPDKAEEDGCLPPGKGDKTNDMGAYGGPHNCGWFRLVSQRILIDHLVGREPLHPAKYPSADLNKDGIIDIADLILLQLSQ